MQYQRLQKLNKTIKNTRKNKEKLEPIINPLIETQKYLIISSDPSSDTDKSKELLEKHSGFEERILSLFFFGDDSLINVQKIQQKYSTYKGVFITNFYWTHFSKTYAAGNPDSFWAKKFLKKEIELFEPKVIIIFGNKAADFLLGRDKLINRVEKIHFYNNIPTIVTLHPSKNWNLSRRENYYFYQCWEKIREMCKVN